MPVYKQKNSDYWLIEFTIDGKRFRRSSQTKSKALARQREVEWRTDISEGKAAGQSVTPITLEEAVERFIRTNVQLRASVEKTKKAEIYTLNKLVAALGPNLSLGELTAKRVNDWRDIMISKGLAPATINRYLATLRSLLNTAHRDWMCLSDVPRISTPSLANQRMSVLSHEDEAKLLSVAPPHLRNLIVFLVDTGARLSEATSLVWENVHASEDAMWWVEFTKTKNFKPRSVPLTRRTQEIVLHLSISKAAPTGHVFQYRNGNEGQYQPFKIPHGAWKTALRRAGLSEALRIHDLRHTFASRLAMAGVPIYDISQLLGHSSIAMTSRYAHLAPETFVKAIDQLSKRTHDVL